MSRARDLADRVLHNRTHEDTEGGRESIVTFKGEQSGGEISTLAQIQASHDGTSDDEKADLIFKTNDGSDGASPTERMRISSDGSISTATLGTDNVKLGEGAGAAIASGGNQNTIIGKDAGTAITTGVSNTIVGSLAGDALTVGGHNVAMGYEALSTDTQGSHSTAIGRRALKTQNFTSATDSHNTAIGNNAGTAITTATRNTVVGSNAGTSNQTSLYNTYVGYGAGQSTTGQGNTFIGDASGNSVAAGEFNTLLGQQAGNAITSGDKNTVIGRFNGNQDNFDIRTSNDQIAISNGDGNVRIFCNTEGYTKHKPVNVTTYATGGAYHEFSHNNNDTSAIIYYQAHASFVNAVEFTQAQRTASANYEMAQWRSGAGSDVEFKLRGNGDALADGSWSGGGADYAEYFEWADGNSDNQNRTGYTVVLDNEKIRIATSDDAAANIIGAVSVNPSVIGDSDIDQWKHKYKRDDFGGFIWETYTVTEWQEGEVLHTYETDKIPDGLTPPDDATVSSKDAKENILERKVLNTDYDADADAAYVSRANRKEWATIGMMGKLRIRKGQQTGDRWIKMRDISDTVEEWLVR